MEVVVRPANLGLGYGNFKEASSLKVNRIIEAEIRGLDVKKVLEEDQETKNNKESGTTVTDNITNIGDLLQ